jgi:hypothetical protein
MRYINADRFIAALFDVHEEKYIHARFSEIAIDEFFNPSSKYKIRS